jgi:hypothetical protein
MNEEFEKERSLQQFSNIYDSLVHTLHENHGSTCQHLVQHREQWSNMNRKARGQYMKLWWNALGAHEHKIAQKDVIIFTLDLAPLLALEIPKLWWGQAFSTTSKLYIWSYIQKLTSYSRICSETSSSPQKRAEITPPPMLDGELPPMIQAMHNLLPPSLLDNVTKVAESYSKKLEENKINIEDLTLETITRDLFTKTDPEMTRKMMMEMAQMFQGLQGKTP